MGNEKTIESVARDLAHHSRGLPSSGDAFEWSRFWSDLVAWPPDAFAFTSILLSDSGAYLRTVSPPMGKTWPPSREWTHEVLAASGRWLVRVSALLERQENGTEMPEPRGADPLEKIALALSANLSTPLSQLADDASWETCAALLELHALADEACVGVGILGAAHDESSRFHERANDLLVRKGLSCSLSRFASEVVRVLPKMRTPQAGITLRSLSHHVASDRSEVAVDWRTLPSPERATRDGMNILLIPWPESVEATDFKQVPGPLEHLDRSKFGFFEFDPVQKGAVRRIRESLAAARAQYGRVDAVVLPEGALAETEFDEVQTMILGDPDPPFFIAGIRGKGRNYACLLDRGPGSVPLRYEQDKHHRWYLDGPQIRQYGLGPILPAGRRWWESMELRQRKVNFVVLNEWLTLCPLICEDLARQDPVARLIQAVGPTLVIALLLDGPQLERRWPGRYASGLADDPGTSVLTLTALGMTLRSRPPPGGKISRVIALWKDGVTGVQEVEIEDGARGVLLSVHVEWRTEWTADGRDDGCNAAVVVQNGWNQVR